MPVGTKPIISKYECTVAKWPRLKTAKDIAVFGVEPDGSQTRFGAIYVSVKGAEHVTEIALVFPAKKPVEKFGEEVGTDAKGNTVHIGDIVNHTKDKKNKKLEKFKKGIVIWEYSLYEGEPAALVNYAQDDRWPNRFSKMIVVDKATPKARMNGREQAKAVSLGSSASTVTC